MFLMKKYKNSLQPQQEKKLTLKMAAHVISRDKVLLYFLLGNIVVLMAQAQMDSTLAQYMGSSPLFHHGVTLFSYLIVTNAVTVLVLQYPVTNYVKRFDPMFALRIGSGAFSLALVGFGLSSNWIFLVVSMVVLTLGRLSYLWSAMSFWMIWLPIICAGPILGPCRFAPSVSVRGPGLGIAA